MSLAAHLTGQPLRELRERAHLSQADAAVRLGVPLRTYQSWESDSAPTPWPRHRLALQAFIRELEAAA